MLRTGLYFLATSPALCLGSCLHALCSFFTTSYLTSLAIASTADSFLGPVILSTSNTKNQVDNSVTSP